MVLLHWDGMEQLVRQLQGPMELDLDPAWGFLDGLPVVVRAPALDEGQPVEHHCYWIANRK